jgi:hypothetical protein
MYATPGATITITGTNFDTNPANDRLRLNSTQQAISAATTTSLTTTLPAATASGRISVTTFAGTTQSTQDFYVPFGTYGTSSIGFAQRLTLGTPLTVSLGTANNIALAIFDGVAGQKANVQISNATFNQCMLYLISPNGTQVTSSQCYLGGFIASLPTTGTYTIGLDPSGTTGSGTITVLSSTDVTAGITPGGPPVTVTTTTPGQDARLYFTATEGERVSAVAKNSTNYGAYFNMLGLSSQVLEYTSISNGSGFANLGFFLDTQTLPVAGRYTLWVQHSQSNVGSETIQLYDVPADISGTMTIGGPSFTVNTTTPGQKGNLTFTATAGQNVSISIANSTYAVCSVNIIDPDASTFSSSDCSQYNNFVDTRTLGQTGTYTLFVSPGAATGGATFQLNDDTDVTGTISPSSPTSVSTVPGQDARLTFSGTAGQRVSVLITNSTNGGASLNLVNPSGSTISTLNFQTNPSYFMDAVTLPATGTYTLWVRHGYNNSGSETLELFNVPSDATATASINGSTVSVATTVPGQNANVTFSGTAGQSVVVYFTSGTYSSCFVDIRDPSWTNIYFAGCNGTSNTYGAMNLSTTGTYTILIDPQGPATGGVTVQVVTYP